MKRKNQGMIEIGIGNLSKRETWLQLINKILSVKKNNNPWIK